MLALALFWLITVTLAVGHLLLIRAALRLGRTQPPVDSPASTPRADLGWTLATALATAAVLVAVYQALG